MYELWLLYLINHKKYIVKFLHPEMSLRTSKAQGLMKIRSKSDQDQGSDNRSRSDVDQCVMCTHFASCDQDQLDEAMQVHLPSHPYVSCYHKISIK